MWNKMWRESLVLVVILALTAAQSLQPACVVDADCDILQGGVCSSGACVCAVGQQPALGGTRCVDLAPYHTSPCVEDHQCSRLALAFQCRLTDGNDEGVCSCQPGHHYLFGRCWRTIGFGEACTRSEECLAVAMRDPFSLTCSETCQCAEGYYERQRGECRKISLGVGDGCVLDQDCQFEGGACNIVSFQCYDVNAEEETTNSTLKTAYTNTSLTASTMSRQHTTACDVNTPCSEPFECSAFGVCLCPVGYYLGDGQCLAELGSPSTAEQCVGLLAEVRDGVCTCPVNFFFDENMRDCVRVTRVISESCVTDAQCGTFGAAARCGAERPPWGLRSCECVAEEAMWDAGRQMCRLFVGIGEECEVDTDCMAGELEITCARDELGRGVCACPEGLAAVGGLCLTTGLGLGDACQASQECTATAHSACVGGACACDPDGYFETGGYCAAVVGGRCAADEDCLVDHTHCAAEGEGGESTCQCVGGYVEYGNVCWPALETIQSHCNQTAQCHALMGVDSTCLEGLCVCDPGHHYRDNGCWPVTDLFKGCSRTSQCYLADISDRVVCRNSLCQCGFNYPYSEEQHTCLSGASSIAVSFLSIAILTVFII